MPEQNRITPKKSLGQNFLTDNNIAKKIVDLLQCNSSDFVVEIGPGMGALTKLLVNSQCKITAIEIDKRAIEFLNNEIPKSKYDNFNIIHSDIRDFSFFNFFENISNEKKLKIIGNIPYNISSDILFKLLESSEIIEKAVITIQKEVAQRLAAPHSTKSYGVLTVACSLVANVHKTFDIPPSCFHPKPEITSSVVLLDFDKKLIDIGDFKGIMNLVKSAFSQRRKMLNNSLGSYFGNFTKDNQGIIWDLINTKFPLFFKSRAENIMAEEYIEIYNLIKPFLYK